MVHFATLQVSRKRVNALADPYPLDRLRISIALSCLTLLTLGMILGRSLGLIPTCPASPTDRVWGSLHRITGLFRVDFTLFLWSCFGYPVLCHGGRIRLDSGLSNVCDAALFVHLSVSQSWSNLSVYRVPCMGWHSMPVTHP